MSEVTENTKKQVLPQPEEEKKMSKNELLNTLDKEFPSSVQRIYVNSLDREFSFNEISAKD